MTELLADVSRETLEDLSTYADLLKKWTGKINLISRQTTDEIWERHILDSLQLSDMAPKTGDWIDLGSGGGLPGMVIAILSRGAVLDRHVTLVESDQRKCAFLRTATRELALDVTIIPDRIDNIPPLHADILSARALADLTTLLGFAERHMKPDGVALFPKGANWQQEVADARTRWSCDCEPITSKTNPSAAILRIKDIARV